MDTEDGLNAYRSALLSKDRVVTAEDIKSLCYEHFGKMTDNVSVTKGLSAVTSANTGLTRTIDISVSLLKQATALTPEDLSFLKEDLKIKLEERSMNILPYRVFIQY
jgi:phage tail protein X